jgi:DNA-binding GntR family transcriptional regulator
VKESLLKVKEISPNRDTLAGKVYESIRDAIVLGDLAPGSLHSVQELASHLKVSRTPVREALLKLADQGMVRFERNRGARVLETTVHDLEQIFSLRLLLEVPATYRATQQIGPAELRQLRSALDAFRNKIHNASTREHLELDARFHRVIMRGSGNRRLADFVDSLRDLQMMRGLTAAPRSRALDEICDDHQRIYDQIVKRDPDGAATAMREHLALSSRLLIAQETGELNDTERFELGWIDLLTLQRIQFSEKSSNAKGTGLSSDQVRDSLKGADESDKEISEGSGRTRLTPNGSRSITKLK